MPAAKPATLKQHPVRRWIADRSLRTKIMIIVAALTIVATSVGVVAVLRMATLNDAVQHLYNQSFVSAQNLNTITADVGTMHALVLTYGQTPDPSLLAQFKPLDAQIDADIEAYRATTVNPTLMDQTVFLWDKYLEARDAYLKVAASGDAAAAVTVRDSQLIPAIIRAKYNLQELADQE